MSARGRLSCDPAIEIRREFRSFGIRQAGDPSEGVIARRQIAAVLVASLTSDGVLRKSSLRSPALSLGELARIAPLGAGDLVSSGTLTTPQLKASAFHI